MRFSVLLLCIFALGACAYWKDDAAQKLTVLTPGAENAMCHVYIDGLKYKFRPPQTQNIIKSDANLIVDCMAPGNRRREVVIKPQIEKSAFGNVFNAGVGAAWDYASKAAFTYPDTVYVDFTNMPLRSEKLPSYNNPDIKQPEEYKLEEFLPSTPRLNSDMEAPQTNTINLPPPQASEPSQPPPPPTPKDKGDLMDVIKQLF